MSNANGIYFMIIGKLDMRVLTCHDSQKIEQSETACTKLSLNDSVYVMYWCALGWLELYFFT